MDNFKKYVVAGQHTPTAVNAIWKEKAIKARRLASRAMERQAGDNQDIVLVCSYEELLVSDEQGQVWVQANGGVVHVIY